MRIAIVGSRDITLPMLRALLAGIEGNIAIAGDKPTIISGGAAGVDSFAEGVAKCLGLPNIIFKPEWDKYGKSAGFKRNQKIVDAADRIVAFHLKDSPGTADTIKRAKASEKPLTVYTYHAESDAWIAEGFNV